MTVAHYRPRRRRGLAGLIGSVDDFMSWLLYGHETWLVALLKGVPLFLLVYFLLMYVPNYIYFLVTQFLLKFSDDVGFLVVRDRCRHPWVRPHGLRVGRGSPRRRVER